MVFKVTIAIDGMVPAQPLGPMVFQWFSVSQPLVTMFFNGCQPLVQRCDGNDTSLRSSLTRTPTYDKYLEQMVTKVELYSPDSFSLIVFLSRFQTFGIQLWAVWQVAEYLLYKPGTNMA